MNMAVRAAGDLLLGLLAAEDLLSKKLSVWALALWTLLSALRCVETAPMILLLQGLTACLTIAVTLGMRFRGVLGTGDLWVLAVLCFFWKPTVFSDALLWGTLHLGLCAAIETAFYGESQTMPVVPFLFLGWGMSRYFGG